MYDEPTHLRLLGFDSGVSESGDVDEAEVSGGGMDVEVEDSGDGGGMDANIEGTGVAQQLARVLLTFFVGGIVLRVGGMRIPYFFYCSMLTLRRSFHFFM